MFKLNIKNIDRKVSSLMVNGFKFSSVILIFSLYILLLYKFNPTSHTIFESGLLLFKSSMMFFASFTICGFFIDQIIKKNI